MLPAVRLARVHRQEQAEGQVQGDGQDSAPQTESTPDDQNGEGLAGDRNRVVRQPDRDVGGHGNEERADADQGNVAQAGAHVLADPDRNQEIGDRDAALGGRKAIQLMGREHASLILLRRGCCAVRTGTHVGRRCVECSKRWNPRERAVPVRLRRAIRVEGP